MKIIEYDSKFHAINDLMIMLRGNDDLSVGETIKIVRKLSNKQFKLLTKRNKLLRYASFVQQNGAR